MKKILITILLTLSSIGYFEIPKQHIKEFSENKYHDFLDNLSYCAKEFKECSQTAQQLSDLVSPFIYPHEMKKCDSKIQKKIQNIIKNSGISQQQLVYFLEILNTNYCNSTELMMLKITLEYL